MEVVTRTVTHRCYIPHPAAFVRARTRDGLTSVRDTSNEDPSVCWYCRRPYCDPVNWENACTCNVPKFHAVRCAGRGCRRIFSTDLLFPFFVDSNDSLFFCTGKCAETVVSTRERAPRRAREDEDDEATQTYQGWMRDLELGSAFDEAQRQHVICADDAHTGFIVTQDGRDRLVASGRFPAGMISPPRKKGKGLQYMIVLNGAHHAKEMQGMSGDEQLAYAIRNA